MCSTVQADRATIVEAREEGNVIEENVENTADVTEQDEVERMNISAATDEGNDIPPPAGVTMMMNTSAGSAMNMSVEEEWLAAGRPDIKPAAAERPAAGGTDTEPVTTEGPAAIGPDTRPVALDAATDKSGSSDSDL
jgi:hypothetical protein